MTTWMVRRPVSTLDANVAKEIDEHTIQGMDALRDLMWRDGPRPLMQRLWYWYRYGQWCSQTLRLEQENLRLAQYDLQLAHEAARRDRRAAQGAIDAMRDVGRKVTIREITDRLGITLMSVDTWRKGSPVRDPLRCHEIPHGMVNRILFDEIDLIMYLVRYGLTDLLAKWCETKERAKQYDRETENDADNPQDDDGQPRLEAG